MHIPRGHIINWIVCVRTTPPLRVAHLFILARPGGWTRGDTLSSSLSSLDLRLPRRSVDIFVPWAIRLLAGRVVSVWIACDPRRVLWRDFVSHWHPPQVLCAYDHNK